MPRSRHRYVFACCTLTAAFLILGYPDGWLFPGSDQGMHRLLGTLLLAGLALLWATALAASDLRAASGPDRRMSWVLGGVALVGLAVLVWLSVDRLVEQVLRVPIDAYRADMLVVIEEGLKRVVAGENPYRMYRVPWPVPLPYGPGLWLPYAVPFGLGIDLRYLPLLAGMAVPAFVGGAVVRHVARGRWLLAGSLFLLFVVMISSPAILGFVAIGHTPAYWPLLLAFAYCLAREKTASSAVLLGLLVATRTTMVVLVPVFLIHVGLRHRRKLAASAVLCGATSIVLFLPFALADPAGLWHCMVVDYAERVKPFVWARPDWLDRTFGVTAWLVRQGWESALLPVQLLLLVGVYLASARYARAATNALSLMVLALLAFSFTVFWPVHYLYLDVFMLASCVLVVAEPENQKGSARSRIVWIGAAIVGMTLMVAMATARRTDRFETLDVGTPAVRPRLYKGFSADETWHDGDGVRTAAWAVGREAWVLLPRTSRAPATIALTLLPFVPDPDQGQTVSMELNGTVLDTLELAVGWNDIGVLAPRETWHYGINVLRLRFSRAQAPRELGLSSDERRLAAAFDMIVVAPASTEATSAHRD